MWKELREAGVNIISTWIDEAGPGQTASMSELWTRIELEIYSCDALFFYYDLKDGRLKGAIFEAGVALGAGKPVYLILPDARHHMSVIEKEIGSWVRHPKFKICVSVGEALSALEARLKKRKA